MLDMRGDTNLFRDAEGNLVKNRSIYRRPNDKYFAQMRYSQGYCKTKLCYSLEEAVAYITDNYETYVEGWYYDNDLRMVTLRRPGEERPPRMY